MLPIENSMDMHQRLSLHGHSRMGVWCWEGACTGAYTLHLLQGQSLAMMAAW